ncbi:MAG: FABP family protein [Actinomycetota bacterium]|nr:FABP family protein [Actinomycetota bacterium]
MTSDPTPALHPALEHLQPLLGCWTGEGEGEYPTIEPFRYGEEVRFWHSGKPFLAYSQRTWSLDDGRPLHAETGYWRASGARQVEVVLAHPTGIVEIDEGVVSDGVIDLHSTFVGCTTTAKAVTQLSRRFVLGGHDAASEGTAGTLSYTLSMAAAGLPLQHHLAATLHR